MLESVRSWAYRISLPIAIPRDPVNLMTPLLIAGPLAFLAVTHGALPVLNARALNQVGIAKCAAESGNIFATSCEQIGYPIGFSPLVGFPVQVFLAFLYKYLSVPLIDGIQIFTLLCLTLGFIALFSMVRTYTGSTVAAVTSALVFYSSPFLLGMSNFSWLYYGFLLFPFYVAVSLYLFRHIRESLADLNVLKLVAAAIAQVALFGFVILMDGYSFVMALITVGVFYTGFLIWRASPISLAKRVLIFSVYGGLLVLPGILYSFFVFSSPNEFTTPTDFLRGEGIDLVTVVIPTQRWLFASWLDLGPSSWNSYAFYGDGLNANLNFLGIATLLAAAVGFVLILRKPSNRRVIAGLFAVVFIIGFVFSLGPSLKVHNVRQNESLAQVTYSDYLMPADDATLTLPTQPLFKLPVINTMRATYRWQLMSRFAIVIFVGFLIARVAGKKPLLILLVAFLIVENTAATAIDGQDRYSLNRTQYNSFNTEVVDELRPYIQDTDKILFLPAQNDFLIARIIPFTGGYTYNIFFDKEVARIRPQQPPSIVEAERKFGKGDLTAEDVRDLFDEGLVDKVIFTYFNLRWDSYWWPPAQSTVESYGTRVTSLNLTDIPQLRTHDEEFFLVVEQR